MPLLKPSVQFKEHKKDCYRMQLEKLNELLEYSPSTGEIFTRKPNRRLSPDADGFVTVWDTIAKKRTKFKADRLCWMLGNGKKLRRNHKILHKNLDSTDNKLRNLTVVSLSTFSKIQEAHRNLAGALKIRPHKTDQFDIDVWFYDNRIYKKEQFCDLSAAQKRLLVLQLKYAKILTKYCIFEK
jgi:hypothetical protein